MNMEITNLKCITPLWTGDIDARSDKLQSSGIMGSLRWWTEAILRSLGMFACDPSSNDRCQEGLYCSACLIFGAAELRRLFRIEINGGKKIFTGKPINIKPNGGNRGWFLGSGLTGIVNLKVVPLSNDFDLNLIFLPLTIISKWTGLGAKTQLGYGVIEIEDSIDVNLEKFNQALEKIMNPERLRKLEVGLREENNTELPSLSEMFFAKIQFEVSNNNWWKNVNGIGQRGQPNQRNFYRGFENDDRMKAWINSGSVPIAPAIKNWLRFGGGGALWKSHNPNQNGNIENWLFGNTGREKQSSKINISCAYPVNDNLWEFRIWGWVPKSNNPEGFDRESFLNNLKIALNGSGETKIPWTELLGGQTSNHKLIIWREFNSSRDTIKPNETDINSFIQSLTVNNGGES